MIKSDKIQGLLFGQAIGDALGLGTEFMNKDEVLINYPDGLTSYEQIIQDLHRSRWEKGQWSDDTEQMLCIAHAIIKDRAINPLSVANNFYKWFQDDAMGIGEHTYQVLSFPEYTSNPEEVSKTIWKLSRYNSSNREYSAANGAVMRTSIIGLWNKDMETNAEKVCKLTHYDPRCIGSCVIISTVINRLFNNKPISIDEIILIGNKYDGRIDEYVRLSQSKKISVLELDNHANMGYTLKV